MRTMLDLPDETFRRLEAEATTRGFQVMDLVNQFIERGLAAGAVTASANASHLRPPFPVARESDGSTTPAIGNADLHALLEEEDFFPYQKVLQSPHFSK